MGYNPYKLIKERYVKQDAQRSGVKAKLKLCLDVRLVLSSAIRSSTKFFSDGNSNMLYHHETTAAPKRTTRRDLPKAHRSSLLPTSATVQVAAT